MLDGKTNTSDEKDGISSMTESVNGGRLDGVGSELVREWFGKLFGKRFGKWFGKGFGKGYENYA